MYLQAKHPRDRHLRESIHLKGNNIVLFVIAYKAILQQIFINTMVRIVRFSNLQNNTPLL